MMDKNEQVWKVNGGSVLVIIIAGFLCTYHARIVYELMVNIGADRLSDFEYLQTIIRCMIILSLILVVFRVRFAIWGMWVSVAALVFTQYWLHFNSTGVDLAEGRHVLSYLRGFIIPAIITYTLHRKTWTKPAPSV